MYMRFNPYHGGLLTERLTLEGVEYAEPEMEVLMAYADEYELYDSPLMRRFFDSP